MGNIIIPKRMPRYPRMRIGNMGQLDQELGYGPRPLPSGEVPVDLLPKFITEQKGGMPGGGPLPGSGTTPGIDYMSGIANDVHAIAGTTLLSVGLLGRVVPVTSSAIVVADCQFIGGRGYLFLNPAGTVGLTASGTLIAVTGALVGATTVTSASLGVANYKTARFFVDATFTAGAGPVTFDVQTLNPATGLWITTQTIFNLTATGTAYANIGTLGVDTDIRMFVTVPVGTTINFSVGYVLKDGLEGTSTGIAQTIFLGGSGVAAQSGYPILSGKERSFYLKENTKVYAVTGGPSLNINVFEL